MQTAKEQVETIPNSEKNSLKAKKYRNSYRFPRIENWIEILLLLTDIQFLTPRSFCQIFNLILFSNYVSIRFGLNKRTILMFKQVKRTTFTTCQGHIEWIYRGFGSVVTFCNLRSNLSWLKFCCIQGEVFEWAWMGKSKTMKKRKILKRPDFDQN